MMNQLSKLFFALLLVLTACKEDKIAPETVHAEPADFEEANQVSATLPEGLALKLWAPGPLLRNAVAITFDNQGIAYVAETNRRKSSDIDIRAHRDWMVDELRLQSLEDTRALHLEKLATELSDQNTWQDDFNEDGIHDYRDLEVQSEYIRRVWDSDGDGRADMSQIYAEGFNDMLTGVAAGILNYDDNVYLTAAPDVWKLRDTDQDGVADQREKISHGYGIHIAYAGHDMSGLTMGVDGKIYWSIGDIGVNVVGPDGKRWAYPNEGAVMRCNPDGSDFEVFAHGLRNPQELAFDNFGNLISVDNDGDHQGEHERYVHIVEGSDSGWRINWQFGKYDNPNESYKVWMDEQLSVPHFSGQAAYITPPLALAYDGPAGLAFNPGTALESKWNDFFFSSHFTASSARSKIIGFKIKPKGASFEIVEEQDVVGGIVPTGITFGADGALYINDWKDSYDKKPTGRIWQMDIVKERSPERIETQQLLQSGVGNHSVAELAELLAHSDQRVRMAAQFELVRRNEPDPLIATAKTGPNLFGRLHGIWGVGQYARLNQNMDVAVSIQSLLDDPEAEVRAQTAKVMGEVGFKSAMIPLISRLQDPSRRVQFFAAEALGKIGDNAAFDPLVDLLVTVEESETHLRHGIAHALSRLNQPAALGQLASHSSRQVRLGAIMALRTLRDPAVTTFLQDTDPLVLAEAARAINDDLSIPEALPILAQTLATTNSTNEIFLRRAINANLRVADAASARRLADYARSARAPEAMRADALWALGYWSDPPLLDRVDGRYRELSGHQLSDGQAALKTTFDQLLDQSNAALQAAAITAAGRLAYKQGEARIFTFFKNKGAKLDVRAAALNALAALKSENLATALDIALVDKNMDLRTNAQDLLSEVELPEAELVGKYEKILNNNTVPEKQRALASLSKMSTSEAEALLEKWWDRFSQGAIDPSLQFDVLAAIDNSSFDALKAKSKEYEASIDSTDVFALYSATMYGGDERMGRRIFFRNETAQCVRCHVVNEGGGAVGPELTHIASQLDRKDLLLALVAPNDRIAPGYGTILLKLKDGKEVAGILEEETESALKVKVGNDPVRNIAKSEIQEREMLPSGMFNMADILDKNQIRDVMAFLVTLK
ncbi:HEAT repeat domain-containing protein [Flavilitoribacter nigricans]|nr:HEAT repeat domain-containing protein [Flavilitoribacter nigricans]